MRRLITSFAQFFAFLVALIAIIFTGNAQAALNSQASDGSYTNKVVHTTAGGSDCLYVNDFHYEVYYRKLPSTSTWTEYFSEYRYPNDYSLTVNDTGGTPGQTYDYTMEVKNSSGVVMCAGASDRGWANQPPTATSASLPGSTIAGGRVCVAASVTDPNANQPYTSSPDTFTYSIVSQPVTGTASIVSNLVCYTPPASGPTKNYSFTIKVTDNAGNAVNGTATGTVTNPTPPPSTITGLTATDGTVTNTVTVSWPASSNTDGYNVYRSTVSGTMGNIIGSTTNTTYSTPTTNPILYYYTVRPNNINGAGPNSNQDVGWPNVAPTAADANMLAVVGGSQQCVTPSVTDANAPQGEIFTFSILSQPTQGTAAIVSNQVCYTPTASGAGGSYAFNYRVTDKGGATFNSSANVNVVGAIQNIQATQGTQYNKSTVSWTGDPAAANYDIYRSTSAGSKGSIVGSNIIGTSFDDSTISGTTHYFYTVVANSSAGTTPDSAQAQGWSKIPPAITTLTATQGTITNKVQLVWTADADATGYEIWRSTTAGGTSTKIATITAPAASLDDDTVFGVTSYFYTVKTIVGSLTGPASNEEEGWANVAPTDASATLTTTSTTPSLATSPTITDPNVIAGKTETYSLSITEPPPTGTLAIAGDKFIYTPAADGLFSGTLTFKFSATDKGGATITSNGTINITCNVPTISSFTLPSSSILQATAFDANAVYSIPTCSTNGEIKVDVFDSSSRIVSSGSPIATSGENLAYTFNNFGFANTGTYTVRMTASSNIGIVTKTAILTIANVNLPVLSVSPSLSVTVGQENVTASLSNPAVVNCPFTKDAAAAQTDPNKCYVVMVTPPPGMTVNTSGTLPSMSGTIEAAGSFPITAEVYKFNGSQLVKIGAVSKTVAAGCTAPVISSLDIPDLFSYEDPNYNAIYKAYSCNGPLSGTLVIKNGTTTIQTKTLSSLISGGAVPLSGTVTGLTAGNYTAQLNITGSSGTGIKTRLFTVKNPPMPELIVSPTTVYQSETRVDASLQPSTDNSCPLTSVQSDAEADPRKCYVSLTTTLSDMNSGSDDKNLPILYGYPSISGDYRVQALISRWVKGTRHDSEPIIKNITVIPVVQPIFKFTGKTDVYVGIEKLSLMFAQDSGSPCTLYDDVDKAKTAAINENRACIANFSGDSELTKSFLFNQYKFFGPFTSVGPRNLSYTVKRVFADGIMSDIQTGQLPITVNDLPPPQVILKGGYKISDGHYYVPLGQAITRATITAGVPTTAKMKISITDSQQAFERGGVISGGSYWITTPTLGLLEERQVTLRVAWQDLPSVYSEQVITAVGGTENNMKLVIDTPLEIIDTENFTVKVKVGKYDKTGINYIPGTMGQWRTQIMAQTNSQSVKTPITAMQDMVNGEAEFQVNPAGNLFMKLTAVSELISTIDGLDTSLTSFTRFVEVVKGSPIEGVISAKTLDGPAPKTFTLELGMTTDNRVALKEVSWQESTDNGNTWSSIAKSNTIRHNVPMQTPGKRQLRARMVNKNTLFESFTAPVEVWAYSTLDAQITGPRHMAPGYTATLASELYREGVLTTNTVNEWTIEAPSGTTTATGATATITEEQEGKVYITLKTRPADTRASDPNAWSIAQYYLNVKKPARPSISGQGPRDVETGKPYHYEGSIRPSWGATVSVNTIQSEWQLPDGSTVAGNTLDWVPGAQDLIDKKPLIFRAWVEGFKDTTTDETTISYVPWEYVWPNFTMNMKQLTVQAPSDLLLMVNHDQPAMSRRFEGLTYTWSFPSNVTGRQNDAFPNRAAAQVLFAGEYDVSVTIQDTRGHETVLTQHIVAEAAIPYTVTLKVGKSNIFDRVPMTVTVRPTIYGGHPLDSVTSQTWMVDGVPVDGFANRSYMVSDITETGSHVISYTLSSKMGETTTVNSPLTLISNQLPVCELKAIPNAYVVYAEAKCTDPDGKVIAYAWKVDGEPIGSTSYRISFSKTNTPQSASVTITAMDDAKEYSVPVSINVSY